MVKKENSQSVNVVLHILEKEKSFLQTERVWRCRFDWLVNEDIGIFFEIDNI
jgi:hypothetical protein